MTGSMVNLAHQQMYVFAFVVNAQFTRTCTYNCKSYSVIKLMIYFVMQLCIFLRQLLSTAILRSRMLIKILVCIWLQVAVRNEWFTVIIFKWLKLATKNVVIWRIVVD